MEPTLRNLRIQTVRAQLSALQTECIALAHQLDDGNSIGQERTAAAHQWNEAMEESFALQSKLENLMADTRVFIN